MRLKNKLYLTILITIEVYGTGFSDSVHWQKVKLQESITQRIKNIINVFIKDEKKYTVMTGIEITHPVSPEFKKNDGNSPSNRSAKKNTIKFNDDIEKKEKREDSIVFSKFGIMAPIVDLDNKNNQDEKSGKENEKSEYADKWSFKENLDIFTNLKNINIKVFISNDISTKYQEEIKKMLAKLDLRYGNIVAKLTIESISFKNPSQKEKKINKALDFIQRFQGLIALIIGIVLLGLFGLILLSKLGKSKSDKKDSNGARGAGPTTNAPVQKKKDEDQNKEKEVQKESSLDGEPSKAIDRFRYLLQHSNELAITIIKNIIKEETSGNSLILKGLVQQLKNEELIDIFKQISTKDKNHWKKQIDKNLSFSDIERCNGLLENIILSQIISPKSTLPKEILETLYDVPPENAVKLINTNNDFALVFFYETNPLYFGEIIASLELESVSSIIEKSLVFNPSDHKELYENFKKNIFKYANQEVEPPGFSKIEDIISNISPEKEETIYQTFLKLKKPKLLSKLARKSFPGFLVKNLPEEMLKEIFDLYDLQDRSEFFTSLQESDLKNFFFDLHAPNGSLSKDLLQLEMEKYKFDKNLLKEIMDNKNTIWKKFVTFVNGHIRLNYDIKSTVDDALANWAPEIHDMSKEEKEIDFKLAA